MTGPQRVEVGRDEAEQRLDRWLRRRWPHLGQGQIEKMCRKGEIRVDGGRVKASTRIGPGQSVRVPPLSAPPQGRDPEEAAEPLTAVPDGLVTYRDDDILILNKPPGLAVQGGSKLKNHLGRMLPALCFGRPEPPRMIHRLDRDTSGVLVLARSGRAAASLSKQFRGRSVSKTYLAVVAGKPNPQRGTIRYGLVKSGGSGDERMRTVLPDEVAATPGAQNAVTEYAVLEQLAARLAVVALRPVTGRTHQLRAHMAALGCPIAGDGKYAGRSGENLGDGWGAGLGNALSRKLHLHALRLEFDHPATGRRFVATAPMPEHMSKTWSVMGLADVSQDRDLFGDLEDLEDIRPS